MLLEVDVVAPVVDLEPRRVELPRSSSNLTVTPVSLLPRSAATRRGKLA